MSLDLTLKFEIHEVMELLQLVKQSFVSFTLDLKDMDVDILQ